MAEYLEPRNYLAMTAIPLAETSELIMDGPRNILYSSDGNTIRRYNVQTQTLLAPIAVGAPVTGFDVTPDGNFIYAAGTKGVIRKINVGTGTITNVTFTPEFGETATWDLGISGTRVFFSSNGTTTPFRQIDLATDAITVRSDYNLGRISRSLFNRSFDNGALFIQASSSPGFYSASTNTWKWRSGSDFTSGKPGAVSRDGTLAAHWQYLSGAVINDPSLNTPIRSIPDIDGGMIFDPLRDVFYGVNSATNQIIAYDTNTWAEKYRLNIGFDVQPATEFGVGQMSIDNSGTRLFLGTGGGVLMANIPQPTGQPAGLAAGNFPSFIKVGVSGNITVRAIDPTGGAAPSYRGTVHFTSNDASAVLPPDYTFTAADNGVHTFTLTLGSVGTRSVTITDTAASFTATQTGITVHNGPVTFIPMYDVHDAVFDKTRNLLYFTTEHGTVEQFNFATDSLLSPIFIGDPMQGIDITADGNFLLVADARHSPTLGFLKKINLTSGQISDLTFAVGTSAGEYASDVVVAGNGKAFIATQTSYYGPTDLRELDLASGAITTVPAVGKTAARNIQKTPDGSQLIVTQGDSDKFAICFYDAQTNTWDVGPINYVQSPLSSALSRDGRMYAGTTARYPVRTSLLDRNRLAIKEFPLWSNGVVGFHPTSDIAYVMDTGNSSSSQMVAYDTNTLAEKYRFPLLGPDFGPVLIDDVGQRLVLISYRVSIYNIPQSNRQAARFEVSGFPSYLKQGVQRTVTVTARDAAGEVATDYRGRIHFTSSDAKAVLPPDYTFTVADNGVHSFNISMGTWGYQTISAKDTTNASIAGTQFSIFVHQGTPDLMLSNRRDMVFDRQRNLLYTSTGDGNIERYDRASQSLLSPIIIGSPLNGMDITPDGQYLLVADAVRRLTQGIIYKINLDTGTITTLKYDLAPGEGGAFEVVIAGNGKALISTANQTSALVPLRTLDLATDTFSTRMMIHGNADISRGESRDKLFVADEVDAAGPVYVYDVASDSFAITRNLGSANTDSVSSVSRNGSLIATELGGGPATILRSADLSTVTNFPNITGGVFFDPTTDQLFGLDPTNYFIMYCYDTTDWSIKWQLDIRTLIVNSVPLRDGIMAVSGDGKYLFISSANDPAVIKIHSTLAIAGPGDVAVGTASNYTVTVRNPAGNVDTRYRGTIHFSSSDPAAVLPADYTFTAGDAGVHTFSATFNTLSQSSITVSDVSTNETATQSGIIVSGVQNVGGVLSIYGTSGADTILYNGQQNTISLNGNLFSFDPSQINLLDVRTFGGADHVWFGPDSSPAAFALPDGIVDTGSGNDQVEFVGGGDFAAIQVLGGDDNDLVRYTGDTEVLLGYDGGPGDDTLDFSPNDQTFQISSSIINSEHTGVSFSNVERPTIHTQISGAQFTVNSLGAGEKLSLYGTDGADRVFLANGAAGSSVTFESGNGDDSLEITRDFLGTVSHGNPVNATGFDTATFVGTDSSETFFVRNGSIGAGSKVFTFNGLGQLLVLGGAGFDTFDMQYTVAPAPLFTIDGGADSDTFTLKAVAGTPHLIGDTGDDNLTAAAGDYGFVFEGGAGADGAGITTNGQPLVIDSDTITNGRLINYYQLENLVITGGEEGSSFTIRSTPVQNLGLDARGGDDVINVGQGNLDSIAGRVTVYGGNGPDTINIYDQNNPRADAYTLANNILMRGGVPLITYGLADTFNFFGGGGNNAISISGFVGLVVSNIDGGDGNDTIGFAGDISGTTLNVSGGNGNDILNYGITSLRTVTFAGGAGADTLNVNAGTFTFAQDAQLTSADLSVNVANGAALVFNSSQHLSALTVALGGRATLSANGSRVLTTKALQVAGKLDLTNNDLIVNATPATREAMFSAVAAAIRSAHNTPPWQGNGITSSVAATNASRALGVMLNSGPNAYATFDGHSVDENSILVAFTLVGDLNLDKQVTISDFIDLSSSFGQSGGWAQGDVNYDQSITITDFIDLAANFGQPPSAPPAPQPAASQQIPIGTIAEVRPADERNVLILKPVDRRLDSARVSPRHQLHHRRHQHKPLKWRSRVGAY
jgi:sugar lactone lactonase YvrE